ncbi:hypothetical protein [Propylenella binzhouense]|uniref:Tat pathway signal sequence domain protein n=1 Tax=Propylenella binzhouense TaxID=2555902 RepID=A0A964T9I7_9HYPH|nr:hypothetical protein [Propylenella binzhouense]MYZ49812.1 hypothetical protein [Propylenella binzhouense]
MTRILPRRRLLGAVAVVLPCLAAAAPATAAGPSPARPAASALPGDDVFLPAGNNWTVYVDGRFGTSLSYPDRVFRPAPPSADAPGRRFLAPDATLQAFAWHNRDGETPSSLEARLVGADGYTDVTYSPRGRSWLVLSGFRGDQIFYEKYVFRGGAVHAFGIEFPAAAKPRYAPLIERIEDSFRTSPPAG